MFRDHHLSGRFGRLAAVVLVPGALIVAGCADFENWWNQQIAQWSKDEKKETAPKDFGAVEIAQDRPARPSGAVSSDADADSPDKLEQRIKQYVRRFPADDDHRKILAPAPRSAAAEQERSAPEEVAAGTAAAPPGEPETGEVAGPGTVAVDSGPPAPETAPEERRPAVPVVQSIAVRPARPEAADTPDGEPDQSGQVNKPLKVREPTEQRTVEAAMAELERLVASQPEDIAGQLRLRMLYLAEGQDERALSPIAGVNREMAEMVQRLMEVVLASREAAADPAAKADEVLEAVEAYRDLLKDYAELQVPRVALCTEAASFGVFKPFPADALVAGQTTPVVVYAEVKNFSSKRTPDQQYQTLLRWQVEVLDTDGQLVATLSEKPFEDISRNRREDFFLADIVHLQADLGPGEYTLRVQIEDRVSGRFGSGSTKFTVRPGGGT